MTQYRCRRTPGRETRSRMVLAGAGFLLLATSCHREEGGSVAAAPVAPELEAAGLGWTGWIMENGRTRQLSGEEAAWWGRAGAKFLPSMRPVGPAGEPHTEPYGIISVVSGETREGVQFHLQFQEVTGRPGKGVGLRALTPAGRLTGGVSAEEWALLWQSAPGRAPGW